MPVSGREAFPRQQLCQLRPDSVFPGKGRTWWVWLGLEGGTEVGTGREENGKERISKGRGRGGGSF